MKDNKDIFKICNCKLENINRINHEIQKYKICSYYKNKN